jgi:hypothetical protein
MAERLESISRREGLASLSPLISDCEAEFERVRVELRRISGLA